jgi:hypothetical protein
MQEMRGAALSLVGSKTAPLAVRCPASRALYQDAKPIRSQTACAAASEIATLATPRKKENFRKRDIKTKAIHSQKAT